MGLPLKWVEVDLSAIERNLDAVRGLLAPGARLMGVVKADAYGHGAVEVGRLLAAKGAACLGVLDLEEASRLREAGLKGPIQLLAPFLPDQAADVARLGLTATVDDVRQVEALGAAVRRGKVRVHVDVDSGLARWGVAPKALPALLAAVERQRGLLLEGVSTHLDYIPGKNIVEATDKLRAFSRLTARAARGRRALVRHAANSAILLDFPGWQLDMARVGNLLYGINPTKTPLSLSSPWRMGARLLNVREAPKGRSIGYGSEYVAPRRMTVGTLAVGYADGLTMEPAERLIRLVGAGASYWGLLRGRPAPFIGRCGIAHVLVDLSGVPGAKAGETVYLPMRRTAANARLPRVYKVNAPGERAARPAGPEGPPAPLP